MAVTIDGTTGVTFPAGGLGNPASAVVGLTDTQTLTNKSIAATQLTGTIAAARLPAGSVLQVVSATTTTTTTTTSSSYVDTALSASITPSSASNKVLVLVTGGILVTDLGNVYGDGWANITRGATNISETRVAINFGSTTWNDFISSVPISHLDSPSTTSATTYKVRIYSSNSLIVYPSGSTAATITLMEIAA
jgi:hypothetical protein